MIAEKGSPITLEEAVALSSCALAADGATIAPDEWADICYRRDEQLAELQAETAWLRHAESLGWEEAYLEELIECGLRSRH